MNRVCITRGPLVYCAEEPDNDFNPSGYVVSADSRGDIANIEDGILAGIPMISLTAKSVTAESEQEAGLKLIPYYAWNNRGDNTKMNVWFALTADEAREGLTLVKGNIADVKASYTHANDDVYAIADGKRPSNSYDGSIPRWTAWPERGKSQQVEVVLKKEQPIESVSVYWYDDKGGVQVPVEWSMEYRNGGKWLAFKPYVTDHFGVAADQFNMVHPSESITTDALRLNITPRKESSIGILELIVE